MGLISESFAVNLRILKFFLLYPPEKLSSKQKLCLYIGYVLCVVTVPTTGVLHLLLDDNLNMERVNYNAGFLAQTSCFIIKFLPFIINGRRIKNCINYFEASIFRTERKEQEKIVEECVRICRRNSYAFLITTVGGVGSWAANSIFWKGRNLPVDVWLPYNGTEKIYVFCITYMFVATGPILAAIATGAIDPLIAGLAFQATTQIKILKDNLQHLHCYIAQKNVKRIEIQDVIYEKLVENIKHHNAILKFVQEYEECFSWSIFSQIAGSVFVVCFCCLQISQIQSFGFYFIQLIVYFGIILAEIYFYCYYGSTLSNENESLSTAIYMSNWYNYDTRNKHLLLTLMERSKRPCVVTAGKLVDLSLDTFTTILRRSYSLVAVFKNYQ